jgi:hypothetical protein
MIPLEQGWILREAAEGLLVKDNCIGPSPSSF